MLDNPIDKNNIEQYNEMKIIFQKSIVMKDDFEVGHVITFEDLAFKKPGNGLPSNSWKDIIGKKLVKNIKKNQILKKEDFI
jgi:N-acetylneuraminate synthase